MALWSSRLSPFIQQFEEYRYPFLSRRRDALVTRPVAVFALGPVHDPHDEAEWQSSWSQLHKELAKFPWFNPMALEMFGGKYDPTKLGLPIKVFAGKEPASDLRDWTAICAWVSNLAPKLKSPALTLEAHSPK